MALNFVGRAVKTNYVTLACDGQKVTAPWSVLAQAPSMYELIKELEWTTSMFNSNPICPSCDRGEEGGHEPDCKLAALLKAVEGT